MDGGRIEDSEQSKNNSSLLIGVQRPQQITLSVCYNNLLQLSDHLSCTWGVDDVVLLVVVEDAVWLDGGRVGQRDSRHPPVHSRDRRQAVAGQQPTDS